MAYSVQKSRLAKVASVSLVIQSNVVTTPLELDAWYHVVGSCDGTTIRFFVNGKMVGQTTATGAIRYEP